MQRVSQAHEVHQVRMAHEHPRIVQQCMHGNDVSMMAVSCLGSREYQSAWMALQATLTLSKGLLIQTLSLFHNVSAFLDFQEGCSWWLQKSVKGQ